MVKKPAALFALALCLSMPPAAAYWLGLPAVPVERILPQLEARVRANAKDAHGQYLLGRVHGAAYGQGVASIRMNGEDPKDWDWRARETGEGIVGAKALQVPIRGARLGPDDLREHLTKALRHLSIAVELAPGDALYHVGLACALDTGMHVAEQVDSTVIAEAIVGSLTPEEQKRAVADLLALEAQEQSLRGEAEARLALLGPRAIPLLSGHRSDPEVNRQAVVSQLLQRAWSDLAIRHYERAFALAFDRDSKLDSIELETREALVSIEAGTSYIRLVKARGARDEQEQARLAAIEAGLSTLKSISWGITPILVPDRVSTSLEDLFDGRTAKFDLAGVGITQTWPWPTAAASFLVWDPECAGEIRSGRQLFGSSTWWMLFEDGYRALETLDSDGDGWLVGVELDGLALWRDVDRDGVSDRGEVTSLGARGVTAVATRADGIDQLSPTCSRGVLFEDGSAVPSFDWVAFPVDPGN